MASSVGSCGSACVVVCTPVVSAVGESAVGCGESALVGSFAGEVWPFVAVADESWPFVAGVGVSCVLVVSVGSTGVVSSVEVAGVSSSRVGPSVGLSVGISMVGRGVGCCDVGAWVGAGAGSSDLDVESRGLGAGAGALVGKVPMEVGAPGCRSPVTAVMTVVRAAVAPGAMVAGICVLAEEPRVAVGRTVPSPILPGR